MIPPSFRVRSGTTRRNRAESAPGDGGRAVNQIEGYLLWQAETAAARDQAESFADRLPWLTSGQREDVVRAYAADRLENSGAVLQHITDRARELRIEYTARYELLRLRMLGLFLAAVAGSGGLLLLLSRAV